MYQDIKNMYHLLQAIFACVWFGFPGRHIKVIGVTGTDGKTTTSHLIYHLLNSSGRKVSLTSSVFANIAGEIFDTGLHITTQGRWDIQKNLRRAVEAGHEYFILETTSHGLHQHRTWGIQYFASALTNVTHEHLDYHKTYGAYLKAKSRLFLHSDYSVINKDDGSFEKMSEILRNNGKTFETYSLSGEADFVWKKLKIDTSIQEDFNHQNILAAYAVATHAGVDDAAIRSAIKTFHLPKGRLEVVYDKEFKVIVDFAHTPNSIRQLLSSLSRLEKGRIIHVFGSAGQRDFLKRPDMGRASAEFADVIIVTEEDYRTEKYGDIYEKIAEGALSVRDFNRKNLFSIQDRAEAIDFAISQAKKGDVVIVTGKGHEQSLARGTQEFPWDEYEAVRKAISKHHDHSKK